MCNEPGLAHLALVLGVPWVLTAARWAWSVWHGAGAHYASQAVAGIGGTNRVVDNKSAEAVAEAVRGCCHALVVNIPFRGICGNECENSCSHSDVVCFPRLKAGPPSALEPNTFCIVILTMSLLSSRLLVLSPRVTQQAYQFVRHEANGQSCLVCSDGTVQHTGYDKLLCGERDVGAGLNGPAKVSHRGSGAHSLPLLVSIPDD